MYYKSIKMRKSISIKMFFYAFTTIMLILLYISVNGMKKEYATMEAAVNRALVKLYDSYRLSTDDSTNPSMKYILQWTSPDTIPFIYMGKGQLGFYERNCEYVNCFVTNNRSYLEDYTQFDVIAFHGPEVVRMSESSLPTKRSPHQKYVFGSIESSDNYPICSNMLDNFFNWTWTYKLQPTARWGYLTIRDADRQIIGPNKVMHWMKLTDMAPVSDVLKMKLKSKCKAAAWFVSNCRPRSGRDKFVKELQEQLKKYGLSVDVYGGCGTMTCSVENHKECGKVIEDDYYFYLSFENSFAEDYVTEKLLTPLQHNAVPIVYGAANYTRFMPDGIYLNARELGAQKLAEKMNELIHDPDQYAEYFRWKKHYSYHDNSDSNDSDDYCRFCEAINDSDLMKRTTVYKKFKEWWNPPGRC